MPIEVLVHVPLFSHVSGVQVSTTVENTLYIHCDYTDTFLLNIFSETIISLLNSFSIRQGC